MAGVFKGGSGGTSLRGWTAVLEFPVGGGRVRFLCRIPSRNIEDDGDDDEDEEEDWETIVVEDVDCSNERGDRAGPVIVVEFDDEEEEEGTIPLGLL